MLLLLPVYLIVLIVAFSAMSKGSRSGEPTAKLLGASAAITAVLSIGIPVVLFWGSIASHGGFSGAYQDLWLVSSPVLCIGSVVLSLITFSRSEQAPKPGMKVADISPGLSNHDNGACPNCSTSLPLTALECTVCKAQFGKGSAWSVVPRDKAPSK